MHFVLLYNKVIGLGYEMHPKTALHSNPRIINHCTICNHCRDYTWGSLKWILRPVPGQITEQPFIVSVFFCFFCGHRPN